MDMASFVKNVRALDREEITSLVREQFGVDDLLVTFPETYDEVSFWIAVQNPENLLGPQGSNALGQIILGQSRYRTADPYTYFYPDASSITMYNPKNFLRRIPDFDNARTTKDKLKLVVKHVCDTYRKPVSTGCVKAYIGFTKLFWVSKRPNSMRIGEYNGEFYLGEDNSCFTPVYISQGVTRFAYRYAPDFTVNYIAFRGEFYKRDCIVPIYTSYNPETDHLGERFGYEPSWLVADVRRSYTRPNGDTVYTRESLPYANYWSKPIDSYSTRIDAVLEREDLFRKAEVDLYSRRPHEETPYLGFELEAVCGSKVSNNDTATAFKKLLPKIVFCKSDSSIGGNGFETVSIPATLDFFKQSDLANTLNVMRADPYNMRSYNVPSCGFHVHVSRTALSVLDLQKLERFMHNPANRDFLNHVAGRGPTTYQKYYPDIFFSGRKLYAEKRVSGDQRPYRARSYYSLSSRVYFDNYFGGSTDDPFVNLLRHIWYNVGISELSHRDDWLRIAHTIHKKLKETSSGPRVGYEFTLTSQQERAEPYTENELLDVLFQYVTVLPSPDTPPSAGNRWTLRAAMETLYPGRFDFEAATPRPVENNWRAATRKSKAPYDRKLNKHACNVLVSPLGKAAAGRYDVLNTSNEHTVEFRLFKGTMNPVSVFRYLEFVDAIVRFVPSTSAADSGLHFQKFVDWLVKDSFNVLRYNNLIAFLISKKYVEREKIRKRDLPVPEESDGSEKPEPVVTPSPTDVETRSTDGPIPLVIENTGIVYETPEEDIGYVSGCDCHECRFARGEITEEEYNSINR
jgi:hypothetical protein